MVDLKATIRIDEQFARGCPSIQLPLLRCDLSNLRQWTTKATSLIQLCDTLFNTPSNVFWSSIVLRPKILNELDHVLENLPFFEDFSVEGPFFNAEVATLVSELYSKTYVLFLRIVVNQEGEGVNSAIFRQSILQSAVLTLRRFRLYCGLYANNYTSCFKKIVGRLRQAVPELFDQYSQEINSFLNSIGSFHELTALMNGKVLGGERRKFDETFELYDRLQLQIREAQSWCELFHIMPDLRPNKDLLKAIPALVEDINESFNDQVLTNLSAGSNQLLIGLCRSINHLKQVLARLYIRFYENYADEFDKINLLSILIDNHELMVRIADKLSDQLDILLQKSKLNDLVARIRCAINQAYAKKAREIIENLRNEGLLNNLGVFSGKAVEEKIDELVSILPYSKEFLHLVLRFFGYDHEKTLSSLIEPNSLPFQLRILIKDTSLIPTAEPSQSAFLHLDDVYRDSDIDSAPEDDEFVGSSKKHDANDFAALLAAIPRASASSENKPALSAMEQKVKRTEERLQKLMEKSSNTLNMSQLNYLVEKMAKDQDRKAEKSVQFEGRTFTKFYKDSDGEGEVSKEDKKILKEKLLNEQLAEKEETDPAYAAFKLEQEFKQAVGESGRFNRGYNPSQVYDDDYEDDYKDYGLTVGTTADERSAEDPKYARPIGPLGVSKNATFALQQKGRPPKKSQKYPQQPVPTESQPSSSQAAPSKKPPTQQQSKPANTQAKPKAQQPKEEQGSSQTKKDGYTGGKGRMMKERHKGQFKQRGADKKLQKANPF